MSKSETISAESSKLILDEEQLEQVSGGESVIDQPLFTPQQGSQGGDDEPRLNHKQIKKIPRHFS